MKKKRQKPSQEKRKVAAAAARAPAVQPTPTQAAQATQATRPLAWSTVVFAGTLFGGAFMGFALEPIVAKALLPSYGGSAQVWSACLAFFQVALLVAYAYSHLVSRLSLKKQVALHVALLLVGLLLLPVNATPPGPPGDSPTLALLWLLVRRVAFPFTVVTTTAPLVQRWLAQTRLPGARDPYYLYVASNAGSFLGLVGYPLVLEARLRLGQQATAWAWGYGVFGLMVAGCGLLAIRSAQPTTPDHPPPAPTPRERAVGRARWLRARWVAAALVPSALTVGATAYLSARLAAIPLLWVLPLGVYLATFTVAYSRWGERARRGAERALPWLAVACFALATADLPLPLWASVALVAGALLAAGLALHGRLAADRPVPSRLTEYYLLVAVGGGLGGVLTALVAPVAFKTVAEYPLSLAAAIALVPILDRRSKREAAATPRSTRLSLYACAAAVAVVVVVFTTSAGNVASGPASWLATRFHQRHDGMVDILKLAFVVAVVAGGSAILARRGVERRLPLAAVLASAVFGAMSDSTVALRARSFYGVMTVTKEETLHSLMHGAVLHGSQDVSPERRGAPRTYYQPSSPLGRVFEALARKKESPPVAVIGLGVGAIAAFHERGQRFTFYEIDPLVVTIARDATLFTYLADAEADGAIIDIVVGDGRIKIADASDGAFGVIVVDAFAGGSVPTHLLTKEALQLYVRKLQPDGVIAFHVSNNYLDLAKVAAASAQSVDLVALRAQSEESRWAFAAHTKARLLTFPHKGDRAEIAPQIEGLRTWTDDYSEILSLVDWSGDE